MALRYFNNAPATTLSTSCTSVATSIVVNSVAGFPIQYPYTLIIDRGLSTEEVVSVTAAAGTTLTVTRGADSSTAFAHTINAPVVHGISAQDPREANVHVNATSGVHGATGAVVGTTDTQTLTNKTIGNTNTINGLTASKMVVTDGSGKVVAGSSAIPAGTVLGTTDAQTVTNKDLTSTTNTFGTHIAFVGEIRMTAAATADTGWQLCDGSAISRTTFSALFAKIGTTFGVGDGSTTFNVPDFRDRGPVGKSGTKALGATGGAATATLTAANIDHTHSTPNHTHTDNYSINGTSLGQQTNTTTGGTANRLTLPDTHTHTIAGGITSSGAGTTGAPTIGAPTAFSTQDPYLAINFVIKT